MTKARDKDLPTDEDLVAYLDGELTSDARARMARRLADDHDLQRRLVLLSGGYRPFREAFAPLLDQAPQARLEAMLVSLPEPTGSSEAVRLPHGWGRTARAMAAGLLLFLAGLGSGWLATTLTPMLREQTAGESASDDNWRQAVAEYLTLYTVETLATIPDIATVREQELAAVGGRMGIALSPQKIALANMFFKRAQLLEYDDKPLGQIIYLDPENGPMALCIIADGTSNAGHQMEQREGLNIVYWSQGRYSFMLIGKAPVPRLQEHASALLDRFT